MYSLIGASNNSIAFLVTSGLVGSTTGGFSDLDALIKEMDKNGCPSEYALYVNTTQDLLLDDMIANGYGSNTTGGIAGSYGSFNNDRDMALNLGFKSFTRGGYTFHKHSWKLLNDPTLLGNDDVAQNLVAGVAIPLAKVADPKNGIDCADIFQKLKEDKRVKYLIFKGKIWSVERAAEGDREYSGSNPHNKHLHISINGSMGNDTSPWFWWMNQPKSLSLALAF